MIYPIPFYDTFQENAPLYDILHKRLQMDRFRGN